MAWGGTWVTGGCPCSPTPTLLLEVFACALLSAVFSSLFSSSWTMTALGGMGGMPPIERPGGGLAGDTEVPAADAALRDAVWGGWVGSLLAPTTCWTMSLVSTPKDPKSKSMLSVSSVPPVSHRPMFKTFWAAGEAGGGGCTCTATGGSTGSGTTASTTGGGGGGGCCCCCCCCCSGGSGSDTGIGRGICSSMGVGVAVPVSIAAGSGVGSRAKAADAVVAGPLLLLPQDEGIPVSSVGGSGS
mmetsp:Transcript_14070/g.29707  ORF Transcript_14070/g.29707 Transcript_14070/m.29707 type:complete len:243 (+) Transcript_14070:1607-2335(+)